MTFATLLPYLIAGVGGFLVRHFNLLGKLTGAAAGPNPLSTSAGATKAAAPVMLPAVPNITLGSHPVLSDAVNAAIKQAVSDTVSGHLQSVKAEIQAAALAAVNAAVADLKSKA